MAVRVSCCRALRYAGGDPDVRRRIDDDGVIDDL
jgi:hypothetical protein